MPTPPTAEQEFIVHLFAPLDGPRAAAAYERVQRIWAACHDQLGMSGGDGTGRPGSRLPAPATIDRSAAESVVAFQQSRSGLRQAVLRQIHDVLNLSVVLTQSASRPGLAPSRRPLISHRSAAPTPQQSLSWADYAMLWARVGQRQAGEVLGEVHMFLARTPLSRTGEVTATDELGQSLDQLLPYREDRVRHWWRGGTTTEAGYALWDSGPAADIGEDREIVLVGPMDREEDLSSWVWSDGTAAMPPFARYLMHAAKLRYEARLLDSWYYTATTDQDPDGLLAELNAILAPDRSRPEDIEPLRSVLRRLRAEEARLTLLDADLARLGQTVTIAQRNLAVQPGCGPDEGSAGVFAADQSLARYVNGQVDSDRGYLQIELRRVRDVRVLAADALGSLGGDGAEPGAATPGSTGARGPREAAHGTPPIQPDVAKRVFVVYGRDGALANSFFDLLYTVGLQPLEWEKLVPPTGTTAPYLGDVVRMAPRLAQANLVLLSPDDVVELHPDLFQQNDHPHERARSGQARPNVLFELGLAYMANPTATVIVEVGDLRPIADLAGLNVIRFDGSAVAVKKVIDRLTLAGCPADTSGEHWLDTGRFAKLEAYHRRPPGSGTADGGQS